MVEWDRRYFKSCNLKMVRCYRWQTLKDRATQLLISRSGSLVTQWFVWKCCFYSPAGRRQRPWRRWPRPCWRPCLGPHSSPGYWGPWKKVLEYFLIKRVSFKVLWYNWISIISPPWQGFTYPFLPSLLIKSETIQFSFFFVEPACWQKRGGRDSKLSMTDVSKYWICRSNMVAKCITQPTCFLRLLISLFLSQKFTAGYYSLESTPWEEKLWRNFPD